MQRISIIGTSGTGKTTLARALSEKLKIPHVELDALHWGPNWTPVPREVFLARLQEALAGDSWAVCGNYFIGRAFTIDRADTIIFLDYSLTTALWRVLRRTFVRCWNQQELWAGNRERFWTQLFSKESLIWWVLTTWRRRRRDYPLMLQTEAEKGRQVFRFRTPRQTQRWLESLAAASEQKIPDR
jgi:adenylate kinase family enzyme